MKTNNAIFHTKVLSNNLVYRFNKLITVLLKCFIPIGIGTFLISYATATMPKQTYLNNASLSGISNVAIEVSVSAPKVSYSLPAQGDYFPPGQLGISPLLFLSALFDTAVRSGVDTGHAGTIKDRLDFYHIEEKTARSFIEPLKKGKCFFIIEYLKNKNSDNRQLSAAGYDAIIRLSVNEILLKRTAGGYVDLHLCVSGQMESLSSGKILWEREERVLSPEPHSIDYYKENGLKELDAMLEKAGQYLAYDFVYLK